jgi:hypothetical protein
LGQGARLFGLKDLFDLLQMLYGVCVSIGGALEVGVLAQLGLDPVELGDELDDFRSDGVAGGFDEFAAVPPRPSNR